MAIWFWVDFCSLSGYSTKPCLPSCLPKPQIQASSSSIPNPNQWAFCLLSSSWNFCIYFAQSQESQQLCWQNKCKDAEETKAFCKMRLYSLSVEQHRYLPTCLYDNNRTALSARQQNSSKAATRRSGEVQVSKQWNLYLFPAGHHRRSERNLFIQTTSSIDT